MSYPAEDRRLMTMHDLDALIAPLDDPPDCDKVLREVMAIPAQRVPDAVRERWPQLRRDAWAFALLVERMGRERLFRPYASLGEWARRELQKEAWVVSKHRTAAQWVLSLDPDDRRAVMESTPPATLTEAGIPELAQRDMKEALRLAKQGMTQRELRQAVRARLIGGKDPAPEEGVRTFHRVLTEPAYEALVGAWNLIRFCCQTAHPSDSEIAEMLGVEVANSIQLNPQTAARFPLEDIRAGHVRCIECSASNPNDLEQHHVIPRSHQGTDGPLVWLCSGCHRKVTENQDGGWRAYAERWLARADLGRFQQAMTTYLNGRTLAEI